MVDLLAQLEAEYCPPIDPALLSAILSDYDLSDESNVGTARETLDQLKESAEIEEQFACDPAGTGAPDAGSGDRPESCPETSDALSRETDLTSVSNGLSSLEIEEWDTTNSTALEVEASSEEHKVHVLRATFGDKFSQSRLQYTLKKCNGRLHVAIDELLTQVLYLDEAESGPDASKLATKGIDAFAEENMVKRGRKGKAKTKNLTFVDDRRSSSLPVSPVEATLPTSNVWQSSSQDIEFISTRTGIAPETVSSTYHKSNASVPKTLGALLKSNLSKGAAAIEEEPIMAVNAHDLQAEFPTIAFDYVAAIISLTYPSTASAHEVANALTKRPAASGAIQIVPQYARPIGLTDDSNAAFQSNSTKGDASRFSGFSESNDLAEHAAAFAVARSAAFAQAHAAHCRAKSDRLMGGAAAYYSQVGREYRELSNQASAAVADRLAATQSTPTSLDLHGIDVLNGVRIAQESVESWWGRTAENRANGRHGAGDRQAGFEIVVGRGTHSEGGRSKLGPAVSKKLREGGWKIEAAGAVVIVKGHIHR